MFDNDEEAEYRVQELIQRSQEHRAAKQPIIYRTFDPDNVAINHLKTAAMSADTARAWEEWADQRIVDLIGEYDKSFAVKAHNELVKDIEKALDVALKQIEELRAEVGQLNAKITLMENIQRGTVAELKTKADVA
jgi:hypothetical protein